MTSEGEVKRHATGRTASGPTLRRDDRPESLVGVRLITRPPSVARSKAAIANLLLSKRSQFVSLHFPGAAAADSLPRASLER
jgi:hypothetical protein